MQFAFGILFNFELIFKLLKHNWQRS